MGKLQSHTSEREPFEAFVILTSRKFLELKKSVNSNVTDTWVSSIIGIKVFIILEF